jgi:hypothetical protein
VRRREAYYKWKEYWRSYVIAIDRESEAGVGFKVQSHSALEG